MDPRFRPFHIAAWITPFHSCFGTIVNLFHLQVKHGKQCHYYEINAGQKQLLYTSESEYWV